MQAAAEAFVTRAPRDVAGWCALFDPAELPVLAATAVEIDELAAIEDQVDAHSLGELIARDPLMTAKLLAHVARLRRGREGSDTETATAALVMLGIPPFFRAFAAQRAVEDRLAALPDALEGFQRVLRRSHRAAAFAMAFAAHRLDHDAAVIHEAALLHDFAELLLWTAAPALALEIAARRRADSTLRSAAVQRAVLNVELAELQHALMLQWRLPALLTQLNDDHARAETAQMRNLRLAVRVARHSMDGWDDPALPDDYADIGAFLQLGPQHVQRLLHDIDEA